MAGDKKLEPLPPTKDKFWEKADTEIHPMGKMPTCDHYFVYRSGHEVACKMCHIGFYVYSGGLKVENGRLVA